MGTNNKNLKDVILVNCLEVPETICVETRFINSNPSKNKEHVFSVTNNASSEFNNQKDLLMPEQNIRNISKPTTIPLSLQTKPTAPLVATVQQCQLSQQGHSSGTAAPLATAITNINNNSNIFNNLSPGQRMNSVVSIPVSNLTSLHPFNLNSNPSNTLITANVRSSLRDKVEQTDASVFNKRSIAIQCKLDDELEDLNIEWPAICQESLENSTNSEDEKEKFLKFVKDNSTQHKSCKECLICGELCKSNKYFYGHMAIHQGPRVLCSRCGQNLEHRNLLPKHKCREALQLQKAFLQCPHYTCNVKAISLLELYDHINEHTNNRMYRCSACRKSFCTGQEFLRHLLIRAKCYTGAKRKRFRVYGLEPQRDRSCRVRVFTLHTFRKCTTLVKTFLSKRATKQGVCRICFKSFTNKYLYKRHRVKCITKFKKRLIRKNHVKN